MALVVSKVSIRGYSGFRMLSAARNLPELDAKDILNNGIVTEMSISEWKSEALLHSSAMNELLYPPGKTESERKHAVWEHPLYNFLHRYYKYSNDEICRYSPGVGVALNGVDRHEHLLVPRFLVVDSARAYYSRSQLRAALKPGGKFKDAYLFSNRDILKRTIAKPAFFGCYGMHEWAMLYSGRRTPGAEPLRRHQESAPLRISQSEIDDIVESGMLRCTHFDAWRFFHPTAQPMNMINPLSRSSQKIFEQPGCLHATMDLFKYAYQLYPFVPSSLLRRALELALWARRIDIRASPYDVAMYLNGQEPLCVETEEGRRAYVQEQEALTVASLPVREELFRVYDQVLSSNLE